MIAIAVATALKAKMVFVAHVASKKKNGQIQQTCSTVNRMTEIKNYCNNCGHECHCGEKCKQEYMDIDSERYEIQCCCNCQHEEKQNIKWQKVKVFVVFVDTNAGEKTYF
jgi:hypothetical protein